MRKQNLDLAESEIHQILGPEKIQEIGECLDEKEKNSLDGILAFLRPEDFAVNKQLIRMVLNAKTQRITAFGRKRVAKVIEAISELLCLKQELLLKFGM